MSYIGIPPFGQTVRTVTTITATASQTVFTPNGGYTVGYVDVYYNGIKLVGGVDFAASNGTTIILTAGATANAVIEIVSYGSVQITDAVRRSGDTFAGAVVVNSTLTAGNTTIAGAANVAQQLTANTLVVSSNTTTLGTAVYVVANGSVGVGTATPGAGIKLDVQGGEIRAGRVDSSSEGGQLSLARSSDNATAWYIDVYGSNSTPSMRMVDVSAGAVSLAINSSGALALRGAVSAPGVGITFPATQVPSSDANTLDDYEEGTWTPTIYGSSTAGTGTYGYQNGIYTKVGNIVTFSCYVQVTSHTGTGYVHLAGLPFSSKPWGATPLLTPCASYNYSLSLTAGYYFQCYVNQNGSTNVIFEQIPTGGGAGAYIPMDTSFYIGLSGSYQTS